MFEINNGIFIISLDFELLYGMEDLKIEDYKPSVLKVHEIVPKLLDLFGKYNVHVTWAVVGMMMAVNKNEILEYSPKLKPTYKDENISTYNHFDRIGFDVNDDPYHYGNNLVDLINKSKGHEIASHTFSHFYCNYEGQTKEQFLSDLDSSIKITKEKYGMFPKSIILPRNQINPNYIDGIVKRGIKSYRGASNGFVYNTTKNNVFIRFIRTLDGYFGFIRGKTYKADEIFESECLNIKASIFLRPYNKNIKFLEKIKINMLKRKMLYSAKNKRIFHLWWHPHNFGTNTNENLKQLEELLIYYTELNMKYNFKNLTMVELAEAVKK